MKIEAIHLSVLDLPGRSSLFSLTRSREDGRFYWRSQTQGPAETEIHVLHVRTTEGIEGICTVGDARYSTLRPIELEHMRALAVGHDAWTEGACGIFCTTPRGRPFWLRAGSAPWTIACGTSMAGPKAGPCMN